MNDTKLIILLFLLLNGITNVLSKRRIIRGKFADPSQFTYQAVLNPYTYNNQTGNYSRQFCSGSLITPGFLLTAAHCLVDCRKVDVYLGVKTLHDRHLSSFITESTNLQWHKDYRPIVNDVGLVGLPEPVKLSSIVTTIKLPLKSERDKTYVNRKAIFTGWGKTGWLKYQSDALKILKVVVKSSQDCSYPSYNFDDKKMICGKGKCGRVCLGDSGGPLVIKNLDNTTVTQIGIASFGPANCQSGFPNVYVRITDYLDWIEQHSDYRFEK